MRYKDEEIPWDAPQIKPIAGHPRLFLTREQLSQLRKNMEYAELAPQVAAYRKCAAEPILPHGVHSPLYEMQLEFRALAYLLGDIDRAGAERTAKCALEYLSAVEFDPKAADITRAIGETMTCGAVVYDWCYDVISAEDKSAFIARFKELAAQKEIGYPPTNPNLSSIASHAGEYEIFRDMIGVGVAVYDEDSEMYDLAAGRFFAQMAEPRRYFNKSGNHPMGSSYGYFRFGCELWAQIIFARMGYADVLGGDMARVAYKWLFERLPFGQRFKDGDDFEYSKNRLEAYPTSDVRELMMAANFFADPYLRRQSLAALSLRNYEPEKFWTLIFSEPGVGIKEPDTLPLARKTTYPLTSLVARTGWQTGKDAPTAMAQMKIQEKFIACHMHLDSGGFQIYYKGNLATASGIYQGMDGGSGCAHYANYYTRTVAHNCVTVTDLHETMLYSHGADTDFSNDGGQRRGMSAPFAVFFKEQVVEDKRAAACGIYAGPNPQTPKFSYVAGDIHFGYGEKVEKYRRSMVFADLFDEEFPAAFVVYDRVCASDAQFKKRWLLHSIEEPEIDADRVTVSRTEAGFGGKLVDTVLLPEDFCIEKIGGAGREYTVGGENFPNRDYAGARTEGAAWRVELSPSAARKEDVFLNAMYVTDAANTRRLEMTRVRTGGFVGAAVRDRLIMFAESDEAACGAFCAEVPDGGFETVSVLLAGIAPGVWSINGEFFAEVKPEEGVLYFEGKPGRYEIAPAPGKMQTAREYAAAQKSKIGDFTVYFGGQFLNQPKPAKLVDGVPYLPAAEFAAYFGAAVKTDGAAVEITNAAGERLSVRGGYASLPSQHMPREVGGAVYICFADLEEFFGMVCEYDAAARIFKAVRVDAEFRKLVKNEKIFAPTDVIAGACDENLPRFAAEYTTETHWAADGGDDAWLTYDLGGETEFSHLLLGASADFEVELSLDGRNYRHIYCGTAAGKTQIYALGRQRARFVRVCVAGDRVAVTVMAVME